jgi:uncharacterized phiE125 gp8 family phage protein
MYYHNSTPATTYAITTAEAKTHLRVTHSTDDTYIDALISAAHEQFQQYTGRQIMTATWKLYLESFPDKIELKKLPVQSITSIQYYDENNALQTLASTEYKTSLNDMPARIETADNDTDWPDTYDRSDAVCITFVAGYAAAANVPGDIKHALKLILGNSYDYRDDLANKREITTASMRLMQPYIIPQL